jgi:iron(III) transport system permease protein
MKVLAGCLAAVAVLIAVAIVFSPLAAALVGTGLNPRAIAAAFRGITGPLGGSMGMAAVGAAVALVIGVPFALLVEHVRRGARRTFWVVGLLVLMVPPYIVAESWIVLFGPAGKISRPVAMLLGFGPRSADPVEIARFAAPGCVYTWPAAGVVMGGCLFPIVALAVAGALRRTDHRIFQSARIAQGTRGVFEIGARLLALPAIGAALLVFAVTLTEFAVPQLLRVRTVGEAVYEQIQEGDLAAAAALSLVLLPLIVVAGAAGVMALARSRVASLAGLEGEVPAFTGRRAGRAGHFAAAMMTLAAMTPALIVPVTSLAWLALTAATPPPATVGTHRVAGASGFLESLEGAAALARSDAVRTVLLAAFTAAVATAFAVIVVRLAARIGCGPLLGALGAGLAAPAPVVGLGLIVLWNRGAGTMVYLSLAIVVLAWLARFFPIAVFLAQGALARVPKELEDAAALAGAGGLKRLVSVVLPGAAPGLAAAWLATYVLSATEYAATALIAPPGRP